MMKKMRSPYSGSEFKADPGAPSAVAKVSLFAFFVFTRAVHPAIIDASKSINPDNGKKYFAYGQMTVILGSSFSTLVIGQLMALYHGGIEEWKSIWQPKAMVVFSIIGVIYAVGDYLEMASMGSLSGAAYQLLLQSKFLITALMVWGIRGTKQSALQWNILFLVMLSMCVYMVGDGGKGGGEIPIMGVVNTLMKVGVSCYCAVLSDKYFKEYKDEPVYIQLVRNRCAWFLSILILTLCDGETWQNGFFVGWDGVTAGVLASFTIKGWSTMYLLAILDSVLKNIGEAVAVLVIYLAQVALPAFEDTFEVPKFVSVMVVILSVTAYVASAPVVKKAQQYDLL